MKKMISRYIREQKRYTKYELKQIFQFESNKIDYFIKNLKAYGILKAVKNNLEQKRLSDLVDDDIEIIDDIKDDDYLYVFTYVGILIVGSRIIKCYPKYILNVDKPLDEMKQIIKVLNKYGSKEQIINLYNGDENDKSFNMLAVIIFLIKDYYEYGAYNNTEDIIEVNGEGEILWDKTVNDNFPIISNNRPYYIELFTQKTVVNEFDYFKKLHECILTRCSNYLKKCDLLDLFEIDPIELSDNSLDDFGDTDYILYRLQSELSIQFNTRKQTLIRTLYSYISNESMFEIDYGISMYGTNSFKHVWEKVCGEVFNNNLNTPIGQLELPVKLDKQYKSTEKLINIIEKPLWVGYDDISNKFYKNSKDTLKPDIVSIGKYKDTIQFIILDAKYYNIQLEKEKKLRNYPGVSDITKQYLYQLAYKKFIDDHKIKNIRNYFLMPTDQVNIINKGFVKMEMISKLGLQDIQIYLLPAKKLFELYLAGKIININDWV